jgi:NADH-quinone oxidoreductase subunit K
VSPISLHHYLAVAALLFAIGVTLVIVRRNAVLVLMGIELILNAAALDFVAFSRWTRVEGSPVEGDAAAVFVIVIAAAEAAVALAIVLNVFHVADTVAVDEVDELRE